MKYLILFASFFMFQCSKDIDPKSSLSFQLNNETKEFNNLIFYKRPFSNSKEHHYYIYEYKEMEADPNGNRVLNNIGLSLTYNMVKQEITIDHITFSIKKIKEMEGHNLIYYSTYSSLLEQSNLIIDSKKEGNLINGGFQGNTFLVDQGVNPSFLDEKPDSLISIKNGRFLLNLEEAE